jgi:prepilin-type N-terminal cleavage/methylation domain-containing protein
VNAGFTLVEVMVALAVSALLVLGVSAATQSTVKTAESQKAAARVDEERTRALELLRQEWRGRLKILKPLAPPPEGTQVLALSTTADSVASGARTTRQVIWIASEKGLARKEGEIESVLVQGPIALEFWDGVAWRADPVGPSSALRVLFQKPEETVVLR